MVKIEIQIDKLTNSCFVVMPFSPIYKTEYRDVIRPAVEEVGLECVRADEIYSKPHVMADIWKSLRSARIVIAELTGRSTNVFYEVGLAHALGKPVIIITRTEDDVPFDLKALRYLYYNTDDPFWGENLKESLVDMLRKVLKQDDYGTVFEGITSVGEIVYEEEHALPEEVKLKLPSHDLSGLWHGKLEIDESPYELILHLAQDGEALSGTMTVSFVDEDELTVLQERMLGDVKGDVASLYGVSYSYLEQGSSKGYLLDILTGQLSPDGNELAGKADDTAGHAGRFSLTKQTPESDTELGAE